jgi:ankyrin repeat protein/Tfp pilus assembly protein PilF
VLQAAFGSAPERIEISSELVKQDIGIFIDAEIDARINSDLLRLPGLRDSISKTLQEKSDGMFLWVELMIKDLSKSDSQFEVKERLLNPPRNLEGIYQHLFLRLVKRLDKVQLNRARKILAFIIVSCRTLEVSELQYAHALDSGSSTFKEHLLLHPNQSILDVCGDFINIKNNLVQFIHFSVQEFLTRPEDEWQCSDGREIKCFRVDLEPSHRALGPACLDYLGLCQYGYPLSDTESFLRLAKDYPFIRYASRYTISHLNQSGPLCSATARKIRDFLGSEKYASWIEYLAMLVLEDGSIFMLGEEFERFMSRLDIGEYKRKPFENDLRMHLDQELERRIRIFGERDPRTEQWHSFLHIIHNVSLGGNVDEENVHMLANQPPRLPMTEDSNLSHITNSLIQNPTLPLHRQIDILLRLQSHLRRVKVLSDPLKMLFRIILQKSHAIPVYVLLAVGQFYFSLDKLEEALEVYRAAFTRVETRETTIKFVILANIAGVLYLQKEYKESEAAYRLCIEGQERVLGKEHPDIIRYLNHLAVVLSDQGEYKAAEDICRRAIEGSEKVLGKKHAHTLLYISNLGIILNNQGEYKAAEEMYRRALDGRQTVLGKDHKDTLKTANNLAGVLRDQGEYKAAEAIYRRVLDRRQTVLGKDHLDTLQTANDLAEVLSDQGDYKAAEEMYRRAIEGRRTNRGGEHPDTQMSVRNLAAMFCDKADSSSKALREAAKGGHLEVVKFLLDQADDVGETPGSTDCITALQEASEAGHPKVVQLLLNNYSGKTTLQAASKRGHLEIVQYMLDRGADVNEAAARFDGRTALQAASEAGRISVVKLLLKHHANVNDNPADYSGKTALQAAAGNGYLEVAQLLLEHGADVNAKAATYGKSRTALQAASEGGHLEVVQLLLERGAEVNAEGPMYSFGRTALQAASAGGHLKVVRLLLEQGVKNNAEVWRIGRTALQLASDGRHLKVVSLLLERDANFNLHGGM